MYKLGSLMIGREVIISQASYYKTRTKNSRSSLKDFSSSSLIPLLHKIRACLSMVYKEKNINARNTISRMNVRIIHISGGDFLQQQEKRVPIPFSSTFCKTIADSNFVHNNSQGHPSHFTLISSHDVKFWFSHIKLRKFTDL